MVKIATSHIEKADIEALDSFAESDISPQMRDLVVSLREMLEDSVDRGVNILVAMENAALTPNQAAERLGMSRTHLYKLLDRGELMFNRVGRDRRILLTDIIEFEAQRQRDRRELAERFAKQAQTRKSALEEILDAI